jgi:putative transposase
MRENSLGQLLGARWLEIPNHFPNVELDIFVVMPNHMHGMVLLRRPVAPEEEQLKFSRFGKPQVGALATIVRTFKAEVTRAARRRFHRPELTIWQANYYERVLRDGKEYADACRYIAGNPLRWKFDKENISTQVANRARP